MSSLSLSTSSSRLRRYFLDDEITDYTFQYSSLSHSIDTDVTFDWTPTLLTGDTFSIERPIKEYKNVISLCIRLNSTCFSSLYFSRCSSTSWTSTSSLSIGSSFLCSFFTSFSTYGDDEEVVSVRRSDRIDSLKSLKTDVRD